MTSVALVIDVLCVCLSLFLAPLKCVCLLKKLVVRRRPCRSRRVGDGDNVQ